MKPPILTPVYAQSTKLGGATGDLLRAVTDQWLLVAPKANPAMLEMFADRDHRPYRALLPWSGEFAGKYLTSAVQVYRMTRDQRLADWLGQFVDHLVRLQDSDGYLGPWPNRSRLKNFSPYHGQNREEDPVHKGHRGMLTWDTWGHYHIMTGLILWYEEMGDAKALHCACKIADFICRKYLGKKKIRLVDTGYSEMNLAPAHALARLYHLTHEKHYLDLSLQIVEEFGVMGPNGPLAGDYLNGPISGKAFFQLPKPRWESLHPIMALAELAWITGEDRYRTAYEKIWWSIVQNDRHNNGGFSSGEQATGNPYDPAPIETCCTIAWLALSIEMLKLTGNSIVADELELTTLNSVLGMHSNSGRWATYNTPSDGARYASAHWIVFQARSGSPELNCCSVNSPRGLGMVSEWALMKDEQGLVINYYGPGEFSINLPDGSPVNICQETEYPISGHVSITVSPSQPVDLCLRLRIPFWSANTHLRMNGESLSGIRPGSYYEITRTWLPGSRIDLDFDMSPHFWRGEKQCQGLTSVYHGPLLLAYDQRYNPSSRMRPREPAVPELPRDLRSDLLPVPTIDARTIARDPSHWDGWIPPTLLLEAHTKTGQTVYLCDFASAGATGTLYRSWLPLGHAPRAVRYTPQNPLRSGRVMV